MWLFMQIFIQAIYFREERRKKKKKESYSIGWGFS